MRLVALRGIRAHLVRFVLSVLAVGLGVAFVTGTFSLRTMMSSTFSTIVDTAMPAAAYVQGSEPAPTAAPTGTQVGAARNPIPESLTMTVRGVEGVAGAFAQFTGPIVLVGADGTAVMSTQAPSFARALNPSEPGSEVVSGRAPEDGTEIALESATLKASALSLGDVTTVVLAGEVRQVQVVGEVSAGAPMAGATITFLDPQTAAATYAADGTVAQIAVYAEDGVAESTLVERLQPVLADAHVHAEALTGEELRAQATAQINQMLGFVETFMLLFAAISLFVGAFIIFNTFTMSVRERMREFALLRALGASPAQVQASIVTQAAVVGLTGSALGILGGLGLVAVLRVGLDQVGMKLSGAVPLEPSTVVAAMIVGTLMAVSAAVLPSRRAARTAPVEAMRGEVANTQRSLRVRGVCGSLLGALGGAGLLLALVRPGADTAAALLGAAAAALVVALLMLAPVIAGPSLRVLATPFVATAGPLGRLARGNVTRNPRRTANTAGALMIGMALVAAVSVLAASATASTRAIVADESTSDFIVRSATNTIPTDAVTAITALDSVATADAFTVGGAFLTGPGDDAATEDDVMVVVGMPAAAFGRSLKIEALSGSLDTLAQGQVAIQKATAETRGWNVGDDLTFTSTDTAAGTVTATIGAVITSKAIGAPVLVHDELFAQVVTTSQATTAALFVEAALGTSAATTRADIVEVAAPFVVLSVLDQEEFADQLAEQVDQILVILYALLALSIIIAVLGIVNTLALSVIERTREIGLMRAVGLGRIQLATILTIESVLTAVFGTVMGLTCGVAVAAAVPTVFADQGLNTLVVPWDRLGAVVALAVMVGVAAALWPAVRAARLPVLQAVASD